MPVHQTQLFALLGLVKHAVTWERRWFQVIMAGREFPDGWPEVLPEPQDADMMGDESDTVDRRIASHREQIEQSHAALQNNPPTNLPAMSEPAVHRSSEG